EPVSSTLERMAPLPKTLGLLALLLAAFGTGAFTASSRGWGSHTVAVEVLNKSGQPIQSFSVVYATCGTKGSIVGGALTANQAQTLRFSVCGEGGYTIAVVFPDGRQVASSEGYVESGYFVTGVVSQNGVTSRERIHGL
ncbi:MAG: hypothetical protein ACYC46_15735, partial [Acidobacteriaceae bacterium]